MWLSYLWVGLSLWWVWSDDVTAAGSGYSGGSSPAPDSPVGAEKKGSHDRSHEKVGEGGVSEGEGRAMRERKGERAKSKMKRRVQSETGLVGE